MKVLRLKHWVDDIWQKPGDVGKKYARFSFADFDFGQRNYHSPGYYRWVPITLMAFDVTTMFEKGDFLAFREIYLGYELPKEPGEKITSHRA